MKQRPILFSGAMVNAILEDRKTQTRRIIKDQPQIDPATGDWLWINTDEMSRVRPLADFADIKAAHCPYGKVGDHLWVRETWAKQLDGNIIYRADFKDWEKADYTATGHWKPSIFMPRDACRIMLEITDVRVELLNDISEEDSIAEGVMKGREHYLDYIAFKHKTTQFVYQCMNAKASYKSLWASINGHQSWEQNPFVWGITFKRI